jgi:hypothetical protein
MVCGKFPSLDLLTKLELANLTNANITDATLLLIIIGMLYVLSSIDTQILEGGQYKTWGRASSTYTLQTTTGFVWTTFHFIIKISLPIRISTQILVKLR